MNGKGAGSMIIVSDRQNRTGFQAQISYDVSTDGTTTFDYGGARLAGSLSKDGSVFTATQISSSVQGTGICLRTSGNKQVANVAGGYYGAWLSTQPVTAVTELSDRLLVTVDVGAPLRVEISARAAQRLEVVVGARVYCLVKAFSFRWRTLG